MIRRPFDPDSGSSPALPPLGKRQRGDRHISRANVASVARDMMATATPAMAVGRRSNELQLPVEQSIGFQYAARYPHVAMTDTRMARNASEISLGDASQESNPYEPKPIHPSFDPSRAGKTEQGAPLVLQHRNAIVASTTTRYRAPDFYTPPDQLRSRLASGKLWEGPTSRAEPYLYCHKDEALWSSYGYATVSDALTLRNSISSLASTYSGTDHAVTTLPTQLRRTRASFDGSYTSWSAETGQTSLTHNSPWPPPPPHQTMVPPYVAPPPADSTSMQLPSWMASTTSSRSHNTHPIAGSATILPKSSPTIRSLVLSSLRGAHYTVMPNSSPAPPVLPLAAKGQNNNKRTIEQLLAKSPAPAPGAWTEKARKAIPSSVRNMSNDLERAGRRPVHLLPFVGHERQVQQRFRRALQQSTATWHALQAHDREHGLAPTHARTVLATTRSRTAVMEFDYFTCERRPRQRYAVGENGEKAPPGRPILMEGDNMSCSSDSSDDDDDDDGGGESDEQTQASTAAAVGAAGDYHHDTPPPHRRERDNTPSPLSTSSTSNVSNPAQVSHEAVPDELSGNARREMNHHGVAFGHVTTRSDSLSVLPINYHHTNSNYLADGSNADVLQWFGGGGGNSSDDGDENDDD